jgi:hypothetical protein
MHGLVAFRVLRSRSLDAIVMGAPIEHPTCELRTVVAAYGLWLATLPCRPIKDLDGLVKD